MPRKYNRKQFAKSNRKSLRKKRTKRTKRITNRNKSYKKQYGGNGWANWSCPNVSMNYGRFHPVPALSEMGDLNPYL